MSEFTEHTVCGLYGQNPAGEWLGNQNAQQQGGDFDALPLVDIGEWFRRISLKIVPLEMCANVLRELKQFEREQCESLFAFLYHHYREVLSMEALEAKQNYKFYNTNGIRQKFLVSFNVFKRSKKWLLNYKF